MSSNLASKKTAISDIGTAAKQTSDNFTENVNATAIPITNVEIDWKIILSG